jgi:hypothetical protein
LGAGIAEGADARHRVNVPEARRAAVARRRARHPALQSCARGRHGQAKACGHLR